jgi:hypothetical protein
MKPFLYLPFLREALEKAFEDDPFVAVYATNSHLVAKAGGHRLKVLVRAAPGGTFVHSVCVWRGQPKPADPRVVERVHSVCVWRGRSF